MGKRVLLDTHVVIDLGTPDGLGTIPPKVRRILDDPEMDLLLSVVSEAEIAIKSQLGKLELTAGDLARMCRRGNHSLPAPPPTHKPSLRSTFPSRGSI